MPHVVKVPLTAAELGLINGMAAIATAACWGEGDYATWEDEDTYASFASLRDKIHTSLCEARDADNRAFDDATALRKNNEIKKTDRARRK
jgi:hypothetical protein